MEDDAHPLRIKGKIGIKLKDRTKIRIYAAFNNIRGCKDHYAAIFKAVDKFADQASSDKQAGLHVHEGRSGQLEIATDISLEHVEEDGILSDGVDTPIAIPSPTETHGGGNRSIVRGAYRSSNTRQKGQFRTPALGRGVRSALGGS